MNNFFNTFTHAANMFGNFESHDDFNKNYKAFSISMFKDYTNVDKVETGGKVILPSSALEILVQLNIQYPMLFCLSNEKEDNHKITHCGVLEFSGVEGIVYLPHWMMLNLFIDEGEIINVRNISLSVGESATFRPQSESFLSIMDPGVVLEKVLRNFSCLTVGDIIAFEYNRQNYELEVMKASPQEKICIVECDLNVEFDMPQGYIEKNTKVKHEIHDEESDDEGIIHKSSTFSGDFNVIKARRNSSPDNSREEKREGPIKNFKCGYLQFRRKRYEDPKDENSQDDFTGDYRKLNSD